MWCGESFTRVNVNCPRATNVQTAFIIVLQLLWARFRVQGTPSFICRLSGSSRTAFALNRCPFCSPLLSFDSINIPRPDYISWPYVMMKLWQQTWEIVIIFSTLNGRLWILTYFLKINSSQNKTDAPQIWFWFGGSIMKYMLKLAGLFNGLCGALSRPLSLKLHYTETMAHITAFSPRSQDEDRDWMRARFPQGSQSDQTGQQYHMGRAERGEGEILKKPPNHNKQNKTKKLLDFFWLTITLTHLIRLWHLLSEPPGTWK